MKWRFGGCFRERRGQFSSKEGWESYKKPSQYPNPFPGQKAPDWETCTSDLACAALSSLIGQAKARVQEHFFPYSLCFTVEYRIGCGPAAPG